MPGKTPTIVLTMGDPCGIGPEVTAKAIAKYGDVNEDYVLLLIGDINVWDNTISTLGLTVNYKAISDNTTFNTTESRALYFLDLSQNERFIPGKLSAASGAAAMRYLEKATDLILEGKADAIVTAPISKEYVNEAGYPYAGHTDYFHRRIGGPEPTMCFYSPDYSVSLVCDHIPLREVNRYVTKDRVSEVINRTYDFLKTLGIAIPTIGVIGLNPHCGESRLLGNEEKTDIIPAIRDASENGISVIGPFTPETAFQKAINKELRGIVAMYHDQGIPPLKIAGVDCVNVSLGLPFIRTSVSHGTAADIAGEGTADESSMLMALDLAVILAQPK